MWLPIILARFLYKVQYLLSGSKPTAILVHLRLRTFRSPVLKEVKPGHYLKKRTRQIWVTVLLTVLSFGWCKKRVSFVTDNPIAVVKWWSSSLCVLDKFQWRLLPLCYLKILEISIWCGLTHFLSIHFSGGWNHPCIQRLEKSVKVEVDSIIRLFLPNFLLDFFFF